MKIGLSYTGKEERHINYVEWLKGSDDLEVIKLSTDNISENSINNCDALVLSGGIDMHPRYYNGNADYPMMPETGWNTERDDFELSLLRTAMNKAIPVMGICRGMQLINVFFEGTLLQHINEKDVLHNGHPDKKHLVKIHRGSLLHDIAKLTSETVNSAHHQSVRNLGKGLVENSLAEDGIIEGFEWSDWKNKPFMLAVQWHPERMKTFDLQDSPLAKNIRDRFVNETKLNMNKR